MRRSAMVVLMRIMIAIMSMVVATMIHLDRRLQVRVVSMSAAMAVPVSVVLCVPCLRVMQLMQQLLTRRHHMIAHDVSQ